MFRVLVVVMVSALLSSAAMAESINGRLGVTGKIGFVAPLQDITSVHDATLNYSDAKIDTGFAGGGGLIYGLNDRFALEFDVTLAPSCSVTSTNSNLGDLQTTDISLGLQYRFMTERHLVPYLGAGLDFIKGDIANSSVDWSYGGHVDAGVDYFLNKSIALTADFRYVVGSESDIHNSKIGNVGKYNPMSVVGTVGVRLFLSENWMD
jgi:outer membrane protein